MLSSSVMLEAVRQFTPSWFSASMSTGIVGLIIATFPYDAPAKLEIGWGFWWANVILFCILSMMMLGRLILFPSTIKPLLLHPVQSMFLGCIPMALATIVNGFPTFLLNYWDTDAVNHAAVVMWTIDAALSALSTCIMPFHMFTQHKHSLDRLTAVWLLPVVPGVVASSSGALVAQHCSAVAARRIILAAGYLWGISVPLALMLITLYLGRLAVYQLPPKELIVSSFLPVGPLGMSALALMHMATGAMRPKSGDAPRAAGGEEPLLHFAAAFEHAGTFAALVLWGAGTWWLVVAVASVLSTARELPFNLGWWGFVFPLGVLSQATVVLSSPQKLDSGAFKVVGAVFSAATLALWCMVTAYTAMHWWRGRPLFVAPCLMEQAQGACANQGNKGSNCSLE